MMRAMFAGLGVVALMASAGCGPFGGECGDSDPEPLVSGEYTFDYGYTGTNDSPLGDIGDGTLTIDRATETATISYTREGATVTYTFAITDVREGGF